MMKILAKLAILVIFLGAFQAQASIAFRSKNFAPQAEKAQSTHELDLSAHHSVQGRQIISSDDLKKVIPLDKSADGNADLMKQKIFSKTASSLMKSHFMQKSVFGKTVSSVQQNTKMGMAIKGEKKPGQNKAIEHKIDFQVQALQGRAKLSYKGLVDSRVEYLGNEGALNVVIEEKLSENSKIALSHKSQSQGTQQMVNFQVNW
ncbi:MAG: hypothetical protein KDD33_05890 [Bdellovibrionales bacterium]|nr:hypothetical protein [Bdellovibrionales bacterium]